MLKIPKWPFTVKIQNYFPKKKGFGLTIFHVLCSFFQSFSRMSDGFGVCLQKMAMESILFLEFWRFSAFYQKTDGDF